MPEFLEIVTKIDLQCPLSIEGVMTSYAMPSPCGLVERDKISITWLTVSLLFYVNRIVILAVLIKVTDPEIKEVSFQWFNKTGTGLIVSERKVYFSFNNRPLSVKYPIAEVYCIYHTGTIEYYKYLSKEEGRTFISSIMRSLISINIHIIYSEFISQSIHNSGDLVGLVHTCTCPGCNIMPSLIHFYTTTFGPGYTLLLVLRFCLAPLSYCYTWHGDNSFKDFGSL